MKKIVINITEHIYVKLQFESLEQKKCMSEVIRDRIFNKEFSREVEESYDKYLNEKFKILLNEKIDEIKNGEK